MLLPTDALRRLQDAADPLRLRLRVTGSDGTFARRAYPYDGDRPSMGPARQRWAKTSRSL